MAGRGQGPDPRRGPRQGGRGQTGPFRRGGENRGRPDSRHDAGDPPDRPRGAGGAQGPGRTGARHPQGALPEHRPGPRLGQGRDHGERGRRHGHRGGGGQDPGEDHQGLRQPPARPSKLPRAAGGLRPQPVAGRSQELHPHAAEPLPHVRGARLRAARDQPPGHHRSGRGDRAGRQGQLRRQRALPPQGRPRRTATWTRRTRWKSKPPGST